jgi:hypothetical protein
MEHDPRGGEALRRKLELAGTPGFDLLPPEEQDYLFGLIVCEVHGLPKGLPPWHNSPTLS